MRRCGEREFHNSFLKLFWVFYVGNHIPYANSSGIKRRPLHLYDTWGLRIVHGLESGLVSPEGEGLISIMLFRIL